MYVYKTYNFVTKDSCNIPHTLPGRAQSECNSFPAMQQILGGHKFKDDRKMKVGTR